MEVVLRGKERRDECCLFIRECLWSGVERNSCEGEAVIEGVTAPSLGRKKPRQTRVKEK